MRVFVLHPRMNIRFQIDRSSQEIDFVCVKNHIQKHSCFHTTEIKFVSPTISRV